MLAFREGPKSSFPIRDQATAEWAQTQYAIERQKAIDSGMTYVEALYATNLAKDSVSRCWLVKPISTQQSVYNIVDIDCASGLFVAGVLKVVPFITRLFACSFACLHRFGAGPLL